MNVDPIDDGDKLTAWGSQLTEKEDYVEDFKNGMEKLSC